MTATDDLRLADLLAALSVATDLGMGHESEKAVRSCLLATSLARACGLREVEVRDVYYSSMLLHLGCTAPAHELAHMTGDERRFLARAEGTDDASLRASLQLLGVVGEGTGLHRPQYLARLLGAGTAGATTIMRATCEVGSRMADRLHLGDGVSAALRASTEVWDGSSGAFRTGGEDIPVPARFALLAAQVVLWDRVGGPGAAATVVRERAGHWFAPDVAATFLAGSESHLRELAGVDVWAAVLAAEPEPHRHVPAGQVDAVAAVFADMVDLKTPFTHGHSRAVAELAVGAAARLGLDEAARARVRRAGLLHDLGRVAVSSAVWERPGALTTSHWEQVRLHPYHTQRILDRSQVLAPLARIAGMHHERHDGSGYHHGLAGSAIPVEARLLAAADAFQAMTQARAHRPAHPPGAAADHLVSEAARGRFDVDCARAVTEAAGERTVRRPRTWPAGLTDREVEVLRLLAAGDRNREIASRLRISPRTAEHHVQAIYAKIGGSTRAAAAVFAMENALLH